MALMKKHRGFTLIELLVVLAIIGTLLTLAVPSYLQHLDRSKEAVLRENLSVMRQAIDQYRADTNTWPASLESLTQKRYLRKIPVDPITDSSATWQISPPPDGAPGVYEVHSGAEGVSRDGTYFADW